MTTKVCRTCKQEKTLIYFRFLQRKKGAYIFKDCKDCQREYQRNWMKNPKNRKSQNDKIRIWKKTLPGKMSRRRAGRRHMFNMSEAQLEQMILNQRFSCAICGFKQWTQNAKFPNVDHDHKTGKLRGLLCRACNLALGGFKDDVVVLENAIKYLNFHKEK